MIILHVILKADDKHPEAEFFEVYPPWADPEQRTIFDKFKEDAFAVAIGKAYSDATGRNVETHWEDDDENDNWEGETDEEVRRMYGIEDKGGYTYSLII